LFLGYQIRKQNKNVVFQNGETFKKNPKRNILKY